MDGFTKFAATGIALALTLAASDASAAIVTATYTGTVTGTNDIGEAEGAFDNAAIFGLLTDLEGVAYTAVFVFDTNQGLRATNVGEDLLAGGSDMGVQSPFLSSSLTIGGGSHAFSSSHLGRAFSATNGADTTSQHLAIGDSDEGFLSLVMFNPFISPNVAAPFSGPYMTSAPQYLVARGSFMVRNQGVTVAHGYLLPSYLTISSTAVPEPATWALLLIGFGGLGLMARQARHKGVPQPA